MSSRRPHARSQARSQAPRPIRSQSQLVAELRRANAARLSSRLAAEFRRFAPTHDCPLDALGLPGIRCQSDLDLCAAFLLHGVNLTEAQREDLLLGMARAGGNLTALMEGAARAALWGDMEPPVSWLPGGASAMKQLKAEVAVDKELSNTDVGMQILQKRMADRKKDDAKGSSK